MARRREFDVEAVTDAAERLAEALGDDPGDPGDAVEAAKDAIRALVNGALDVIDANGGHTERARRYWYAHILGALDDQSPFLGGSMVTMQDSADELREEKDEEEN